MQITYEKYSPSIILNCARYLGSKLPPNNRAWHTFSCIDPTARGNEWTVGQVKVVEKCTNFYFVIEKLPPKF